MSSRLIYTYIIGLLALGLLFFLAVPYYSKHIPEGIEQSAREKLTSVDANWASVKAISRDLILSGKAPTPQHHQTAINAIEQVSSVRNIHDETTQNIVSPYVMSLGWKDEKLMVNGLVPDEQSQKKVTDILRQKYGNNDISQQLKIAQGQPEKWTELVSTILNNILALDRADIDLIDQNLGLSAQTEKSADKEKLLRSLEPFLEYGYSIKSHVIAEDAAKVRCQRQFDELLNNNQIYFASGKAVIEKTSHDLLNQLAQTAQICPNSLLEIAGHTDNQGSQESNLLLSRKRAQSVAQWLIKSGVSSQHIKSIGYASERPLADNNTESGRAKNRRIEFTVRSN